MVTMSLHSAVRPRDWDTAVMEKAAAFESTPMASAIVLLLAYGMYVDRGQPDLAAQHYRRAKELLENLDDRILDGMVSEVVLHEALVHGDAAEARRWLSRGRDDGSFDWKLAEAAVLLCEGNTVGASLAMEQAALLESKLPPVGAYEVERRWFAELGARMREAAA